jgi:hypothetical protein
MSLYVTTADITELQVKILHYANDWARKEKTPIPQKKLIEGMENQKENPFTVINSLRVLLKKGYISRTKVYGEGSQTFYKLIRSI